MKTVNYSTSGPVTTLTLNRPDSLNAFNSAQRADFLKAVNQANSSDETRVVVVTGAGRGFCSGADLADVDPTGQNVEDRINREYKPFLIAIAESPKPWIAAVNGIAAGIGAALAMTCDVIIMQEDATFYQAFSNIGLIPDGGTSWHLTQQLGPKRAFEMMVMGEKIPAAECLKLGLINQVADGDSLPDVIKAYTNQLTTRAPLSLEYTKQVMRQVSGKSLEEAISIEAKLQLITSQSEDFKEGKLAFLEKRSPEWKGR